MRPLFTMITAATLALPALAPATAQPATAPPPAPMLYETNGKTYQTLEECQRAKKRAKARGAIAGAVIAGAGAALLGGNVGETALVAGAGALAGREIGRASKKQC